LNVESEIFTVEYVIALISVSPNKLFAIVEELRFKLASFTLKMAASVPETVFEENSVFAMFVVAPPIVLIMPVPASEICILFVKLEPAISKTPPLPLIRILEPEIFAPVRTEEIKLNLPVL